MSGPKHLWSGDWQKESEQASDELANRRVRPRAPQPGPEPAPEKKRSRALPVTLVALVFLVVAGIGVAALLSGGGDNNASTSQTQASAPSPPPTNPTNPTSPTNPTTPRPATPQPTSPQPTSPQPTTPQAVTPPTSSLGVPSPPVSWLGMEIETLPPGAAVVETVALGSPSDLAGLEPGDVIVEVNHQAITRAGDIARAIQGLQPGQQVPIQISHGSALEQTNITLGAPPSLHP